MPGRGVVLSADPGSFWMPTGGSLKMPRGGHYQCRFTDAKPVQETRHSGGHDRGAIRAFHKRHDPVRTFSSNDARKTYSIFRVSRWMHGWT